MAYRRGRCTNFDYCRLADERRDVDVRQGLPFICYECGGQLTPPPASRRGRPSLRVGLVAGAIGGAGYLLFAATDPSPPAQSPAAPQAAAPLATPEQNTPALPAPVPPAEITRLTLQGSTALGASLVPRIAAAYLAAQGDRDISITPMGAAPHGEILVSGQGKQQRDIIRIHLQGSGSALADLARGHADLAMVARPLTAAEATRLAPRGDMESAACRHLLARDGLAVIAHPANRLPHLTLAQLRAVLAGSITDWADLGARRGAITLVLPASPAAGDEDALSALLPEAAHPPATARRVAGSAAMAEIVAADPRALAILPLTALLSGPDPALARTRTLGILPASDSAAPARAKTAPGERPRAGPKTPPPPVNAQPANAPPALTRGLYLYSEAVPRNPEAARFLLFALSAQGQSLARFHGLVPAGLAAMPPAAPPALAPPAAGALAEVLPPAATQDAANPPMAAPQLAPFPPAAPPAAAALAASPPPAPATPASPPSGAPATAPASSPAAGAATGAAAAAPSSPYQDLRATARHLAPDLHFASGTVTLADSDGAVLDHLTALIVGGGAAPKNLVLVGHTDDRGAAAFNQSLSERRAQTIADKLAARGIVPGLLIGVGAANPIAANDTETGRAANRRVEVFLRP